MMVLNDKKVAFIMCVNDQQQLDEAVYYIQRIKVPDGYEVDIITIAEADSMAAGYNAGMNSSDAKYKVYLHQDVLILNENFISDMLEVFKSSEEIGLLGCLGARMLPTNAYAISAWDTGRVYHNGELGYWDGYQKGICEVDAVDGLLMATQYDIPWREDLFDLWDFYDISQCFEFQRAGKKVVVPYQKNYWCDHDNQASKLWVYDKYRRVFIDEYSDVRQFEMEEADNGYVLELEKLRQQLKVLLENFLDAGDMDSVCSIFAEEQNRGYACLREYEEIYQIYNLEEGNGFVQKGMTAKELVQKLRKGKYLLKRIEYVEDVEREIFEEIERGFSVYAIAVLCKSYCRDRVKVMEKILGFFKNGNSHVYEVLLQLKKSIIHQPYLERRLYVRDIVTGSSIKEKILVVCDGLDPVAEKWYEVYKKTSEKYHINLVIKAEKERSEAEAEKYRQWGIKLNATVMESGHAIQFMWDMGKYLFEEFRYVLIIGKEAEGYVKLYHRTDIPVFWYVEDETVKEDGYSTNIQIRDMKNFPHFSEELEV